MVANIILTFIFIVNIQGTFASMESFVVGGDYAEIEEFPHAVFISIQCAGRATICGGSIVNQMLVLTAAHCLERCSRGDTIKVYVGSKKKRKGAIHEVTEYRLHKGFKKNIAGTKCDIALAKVDTPMKLGRRAKRIILMRQPPFVDTGFVSGWGLTNEVEKTHTKLLKKVKQRIWKRKQCAKIIWNLPVDTICGGALYAKDYAAKGDSGSALVIRGAIQVGLVSFKYMSPGKASLVIYTDVAYHYNWIVRTARELACWY